MTHFLEKLLSNYWAQYFALCATLWLAVWLCAGAIR